MSAGDSEAPPTYYFSGITFNPDFYQSTTGSYLTQTTAKNYFLTYPSAQGTETITTLNSSSINSSSATSELSIVPSQTTGTLNIGSNSTTTTRTTGAINIGSNVLGTTPITIGMSGKSTTALNGTVSVGSSMNTNGISNTGTITSSGSISANGGLSVATGQTLVSNSMNGTTAAAAQTIGGNIDTGSITVGGALTTGSITLGGVQTTGDINIGNTNATGDIYIGNGSNSTTGANKGTCSIQKLQVGNTTASSGNGIGTGTPFRCVIVERNVGSTTSATGTYTIPGAPTEAGNPIVFASINSANSNYWIVVNPASTTTFTYQKSYWTGTGFGGATNENFNYVAYYL